MEKTAALILVVVGVVVTVAALLVALSGKMTATFWDIVNYSRTYFWGGAVSPP